MRFVLAIPILLCGFVVGQELPKGEGWTVPPPVKQSQANGVKHSPADIGRQFAVIEPVDGTFSRAVSDDGRFIVSTDYEKNRVYVQSSADGGVVANISPPPKYKITILSECCLSPGGDFVAAGVEKGEGQYENPAVVVWDVATGRVDGTYVGVNKAYGFTDCFDAIAVTKDHVIATVTARNGASLEEKSFVRVWDRASSKLVHSFAGHRRGVKALAVYPASGLVATGGEDRIVIVWEAKTGREVAVLDEHESEIEAVAFSPDGTKILSGGFECSVRLWDIASRKRLAKWQLGLHDAQEEAKMRALEAQRDLEFKVSLLAGNPKRTESLLITWPFSRVRSVAFSPDGGRAVVGLLAIAPQTLTHATNPVLIDLKSGEVIPLPAAFQAEPISAVKAVFVRDGNAIMFNKEIRERVRGEDKARTVLSVTGIP